MQAAATRIELFPGWAFVRCEDEKSPHNGDWFLEDPDKAWVARFWDGPQSGEDDCRAFADALRQHIASQIAAVNAGGAE